MDADRYEMRPNEDGSWAVIDCQEDTLASWQGRVADHIPYEDAIDAADSLNASHKIKQVYEAMPIRQTVS